MTTLEQTSSVEALVKDLASTVRNLQEEVSGLKRDKENAVDASRRKNKRPRDDEDVGESENNAETHHACDGKSSEEDSGTSDTEAGNTPKAYAVSTEGKAFLEATFGSKLDYTVRRKQVDKISSPDTKWVKTPVLLQSWRPSSPKKW